MRVKPISAEKANENTGFSPWPAGDYDFTVHEALEERSKSSGNEQIKLTLYVFNRDGNKRTVFDYLSSTEESQWKVRHFCEAVGLTEQYENGDLEVNDIVEKSGELRLRVKPASNGYPANNSVGDYVPRVADLQRAAPRPPTRPVAKPALVELDDEIPF